MIDFDGNKEDIEFIMVKDLSEAPPAIDIMRAESIIEVEEIAKKNKIDKTYVIYTIIDLGICKKKYNYQGQTNRTDKFWKKAKSQDRLKKIFIGIGPKNLRIMWENILVCQDMNSFFYFIKNNEDILNKSKLDAKYLIKSILAFNKQELEESYEKFLSDFENKIKLA